MCFDLQLVSILHREHYPYLNTKSKIWGHLMIFYIVYILSIIVLILHFTGFLARRNIEWAVMAAAVALLTVNILDIMDVPLP